MLSLSVSTACPALDVTHGSQHDQAQRQARILNALVRLRLETPGVSWAAGLIPACRHGAARSRPRCAIRLLAHRLLAPSFGNGKKISRTLQARPRIGGLRHLHSWFCARPVGTAVDKPLAAGGRPAIPSCRRRVPWAGRHRPMDCGIQERLHPTRRWPPIGQCERGSWSKRKPAPHAWACPPTQIRGSSRRSAGTARPRRAWRRRTLQCPGGCHHAWPARCDDAGRNGPKTRARPGR